MIIPLTKKQLLEQIDLAQYANNGSREGMGDPHSIVSYQAIRCECTHTSIGTNPCDYCLIFFALKYAKEYISDVIEAENVSDMIFTELEDKL